jgi:hypothetical protein
MLTILVFEIKEGKKCTKSFKKINRNLSLLIRGGIAEGHMCGAYSPENLEP